MPIGMEVAIFQQYDAVIQVDAGRGMQQLAMEETQNFTQGLRLLIFPYYPDETGY